MSSHSHENAIHGKLCAEPSAGLCMCQVPVGLAWGGEGAQTHTDPTSSCPEMDQSCLQL